MKKKNDIFYKNIKIKKKKKKIKIKKKIISPTVGIEPTTT